MIGQQQFQAAGTFGTADGVTFQVGSSNAEKLNVDTSTAESNIETDLGSVSSNYSAGAIVAGAELGTQAGANGMIATLDTAVAVVGTLRSQLGAASNSLQHVFNNLQNMSTNVQQAHGRIMDTDHATETSNMTTKQMLMQAGSAMLKQSNSMNGMVMSRPGVQPLPRG